MNIVLDTNILVSGLIKGSTTSAPKLIINAFLKNEFLLIISTALLDELITTCEKPRLAPLIPPLDQTKLLSLLEKHARIIEPKTKITACRDKEDNMVLSCAIDGLADCVVTRDNDLLILHPFQGNLDIINPAQFLQRLKK